jgi:hypothetical protein
MISFSQGYDTLKIAQPPQGGMYIGSYEWMAGQVDTFEMSIDRPTAWFGDFGGMGQNSAGFPVFHIDDAEEAWQNGQVIIVNAMEAYPNPNSNAVPGFTVDKLLNGLYDTALLRLANEFAQFSKPMFFFTTREPIGICFDYIGGFGPDGDKSTSWALENDSGLNQFDPSGFPNASLYSDLGDPEVSDGIERWIAAHRYYYHFFTQVHGLKFLTFETGGFAVHDSMDLETEIAELIVEYPESDPGHIRKLIETSRKFEYYYPGDDYTDWVSINFYTIDYYADDWTGLEQDYLIPTSKYLEKLDYTMECIRREANGKPLMFLEIGFPDGMKKNSLYAASKIDSCLNHFIINYPEINGLSFWTWHPLWMVSDFWPFDCLIRPGTIQADTLKSIMNANPGKFHSCVYFSDGSLHPNCSYTTTVNDISEASEPIIFPNPVTDYFTISHLHDNFFGTVSIVNIFGQVVANETKHGPECIVELQDLTTGIYLVLIQSDKGEIITEKIYIE